MVQRLNNSLFKAQPKISAPLDPDFRPLFLASRNYRQAVTFGGNKTKLLIALERNAGLVTRWDLEVFAPGSPHDEDSFRYVERTIKFLLWARGGWKIYLAGPRTLGERIRNCYSA